MRRTILVIAALAWVLTTAPCAVAAESPSPPLIWYRDSVTEEQDYYVAFRGQVDLLADGDVDIELLGSSWFVACVDGQYFAEGPARFPAAFPQYQTHRLHLSRGRHILAIQVHQIGLSTRILPNLAPFLYCTMQANQQPLRIGWKCARLAGYVSQVKRINPQLGFIEWCDTRQIPDWQAAAYDDSRWPQPVSVQRKLGPLQPLSIANTRTITHSPQPVASGPLADTFGYERDNPAARFFLRDLSPAKLPPQGVWRRYDLGRVGLIRPRFVLDLPAGAVVEFAYSESLAHGRVSPWITLSAGDSCNLDHYLARGGRQEFFPLTPKGGRFLEIHVLAPPDQIHFIEEQVLERCYHDQPQGTFQCDDPLLNRIWSVGVDTLRACCEDALIDNPTRERGQWAGDVVSVGMDIAASAYADLRLCRRALVQCAQCARPDGLVSGLCPGGGSYLSTYAAQWTSACIHYWELTGDLSLLQELFPYAQRNFSAFGQQYTPDGLKDSLGWGFVDWGYVRNPGPSDMAVNLHYLSALRDMNRWCTAMGNPLEAARYRRLAEGVSDTIAAYYSGELAGGGNAWSRIGYHRAVLGLRLGFFKDNREKSCLQFIKSHMLSCFPNDPTAPRLSDPAANNPRLITAYFAHYAMPLLIEHGEMDFVLDQYRKCWGWALEDGRTTWLEVFDPRWSHCHQWSGCPTWQLTRYLLGLNPRYDLGPRHYALCLSPGSLQQARGSLPLPDGSGVITIHWTRDPAGFQYHLQTPTPIDLHLPATSVEPPRQVHIERQYDDIVRP